MIARAQRLAQPIRRRDALKRMLLLSVALHLALLLSLLTLPSAPPMHEASAPTSVEIMADEGAAEGAKLPAPSYAPAIAASGETPATTPPPPPAAPTFAVPTDEIPTPPLPVPPPTESAAAPAVPPAPPTPPTAAAEPPPPPAPATQVPPQPPAPMPTPSAPAEVAELPPPPPVPPVPAPPPPAPTTATRPPPPQPRAAARPPPRPAPLPFTMGGNSVLVPVQPQRTAPTPERTANNHGALDLTLGPQALNSAGAPPHSSHGVDASIRVEGADVGDDWIQQLHEWWERHAFYPPGALANGEDGVVEIHMVIARDGRIDSVEVVSSSGSRWLDMAGVSVWRNAHLRPFPSGTSQPRADIFVSLHYILLRGRG